MLKRIVSVNTHRYGRVNLELSLNALITGILGLLEYLFSQLILSEDISNKVSKEMHVRLKNSDNAYKSSGSQFPSPIHHPP